MKSIRLGIIGGAGKMGQLFKAAFSPFVKEVLVSDLGTPLSTEALVKTCEVVLLSVPIRVTSKVIREIAPLMHAEQLLMDLTSLKQKPCEEMLRSDAAVIGMHPLFGPLAGGLKNQRVILCPVREKGWKPWLKEILERQGASVHEMDPEAHDRSMGVVQALVHFSTLLFSETVRREGHSFEELGTIATPAFQMEASLVQRVLSQSAALYADIEMENPFFLPILENFESAFRELKTIVVQRDFQAFCDFFERR
jgi:prephenate dehydrogenase